MKLGDNNTEYFHRKMRQIYNSNTITSIVNDDGVLVEDEEAVGSLATDYFSRLFTSSHASQPIDELNNLCGVALSTTQRSALE